jgi:hypothetical protein
MHYENEDASSSVSDVRSEVDKTFSTHQTLMSETQMVPETSVIFNELTKLIAREVLSLGDLHRYVVIKQF